MAFFLIRCKRGSRIPTIGIQQDIWFCPPRCDYSDVSYREKCFWLSLSSIHVDSLFQQFSCREHFLLRSAPSFRPSTHPPSSSQHLAMLPYVAFNFLFNSCLNAETLLPACPSFFFLRVRGCLCEGARGIFVYQDIFVCQDCSAST